MGRLWEGEDWSLFSLQNYKNGLSYSGKISGRASTKAYKTLKQICNLIFVLVELLIDKNPPGTVMNKQCVLL